MRLRGALASAFAMLWASASDANEPSTDGSAVAITSTGQCLKPAAVAFELERLRPRQPGDGRLRLDIREGQRDVTVEFYRDGRLAGDRSFDDVPSHCGERIRLVAVAIAVALERLLEAEAKAEADEAARAAPPASLDDAPAVVAPVEGAPPPLENRAPAPSTKLPGPRESIALDVFMAPAAEAAVGVTPAVGAGAALDVGLYLGRRLSFGASGHWLVGLPYDLGPGEVEARLLVVALGGCFTPYEARPLRVAACSRVLGGSWRAVGRGYGRDSEATQAWLAVEVGPRAEVALSKHIALHVEADVLVPFTRPTLEIRDRSEILRATTPAVGALLSAGPLLRF
jgi:hypothetical protein